MHSPCATLGLGGRKDLLLAISEAYSEDATATEVEFHTYPWHSLIAQSKKVEPQ